MFHYWSKPWTLINIMLGSCQLWGCIFPQAIHFSSVVSVWRRSVEGRCDGLDTQTSSVAFTVVLVHSEYLGELCQTLVQYACSLTCFIVRQFYVFYCKKRGSSDVIQFHTVFYNARHWIISMDAITYLAWEMGRVAYLVNEPIWGFDISKQCCIRGSVLMGCLHYVLLD